MNPDLLPRTGDNIININGTTSSTISSTSITESIVSTTSARTEQNNKNTSDNNMTAKQRIAVNFNIESWRGDNKQRYFLSDMFNLKNGKMDKKITIDNVSDAVVWNIVYLIELHQNFLIGISYRQTFCKCRK